MKKLLRAAPLLALPLLLPAAAPGDPVVECDAAEVVNEGETASYDGMNAGLPDGGDVPHGESQTEVVTLAGAVSEEALKVTMNATMTYDAPGDLEFRAYDADGNELGSSTAFNPTDGNIETLILTVDTCEEITFVVENYAGIPGTPVTVEVSVEGKYPRKR